MSKPTSKSFLSIVVESLGWPMFWGLAATFAFYLLIAWGVLSSEMVVRYFAGHPVEYVETALFFIGVVALLFKATDVAFQFGAIAETKLPKTRRQGDASSQAEKLLDAIDEFPEKIRETYLGRRLANAARYVYQSDSAEGIDEQLRYLSDVDSERSHDSYSFVRIIIWATPMLGFLGTVIGITLALGNLSPEALVETPKEAMQGLLAGLSVAFDTTALALSLSIVLMFLQFLVREVENHLLTAVDRCAEDELVGRFMMNQPIAETPQTPAFAELSEALAVSVKDMSQQQAETLRATLQETQSQWKSALVETGNLVQSNLQQAVVQMAERQQDTLSTAEEVASQRVAERWHHIEAGIQSQASLLAAQHQAITQQADVMHRVLAATGEIRNLETTLNENLSALANAKNFQDTVFSLSAAIQLLTARLGISSRDVNLRGEQERAA